MESLQMAGAAELAIADNQLRCAPLTTDMSENDFSATDMDDTPIEEKPNPAYQPNGNHSAAQSAAPPNESTPLSFTEKSHFVNDDIVELARCAWRGSTHNQKFLKGCLWSPDGTCILTAINGEGMQVFELPRDLYDADAVQVDRPLDVLRSAVHVPEGGTIYDYCWYPFMNSTDPTSCCWLATRQHEPIQMWDAYTGTLRCSYRGYNAVDEVESAFSVAFSADASHVIGGYRKNIKIFKTDIPGRDFDSIVVKSPVSALACDMGGNVIAAGSWTSTITVYDARQSYHEQLCQMERHRGGITYLRFITSKGMLVSGARKDHEMHVWDLRNVSEPIVTLARQVDTNQRIYFDISRDERWLVSGDTSGCVRAWHFDDAGNAEEQIFNLHHDCCNGVSLHPSRPIFATSSGQHHFSDFTKSSDEESVDRPPKKPRENSLIFWWCGKVTRDIEME